MKKNLFLAVILSLSALCSLLGQTTKKSLNYQAVILDPKAIDIPGASLSGQPLSKGKVCMKFTFVNAQGNVDYEETQQTTTDEYGLVSISVGTGTYNAGTYRSFESIVWDANVKSMKVAVSYDGCNSFKQVSTQALNYTPYALYAEAVDYKNVKDAPTKLSQFSNDAGYLIPKDLDPIKADIKKNSEDIKTNTADIKTNAADIKMNTADIKTNAIQIASANQIIAENKKASDDSFLIVKQSISDLGAKVISNTNSIVTIEGKINEQQNLIYDTRNQLNTATNTINSQINGLQNQVTTTANTVNSLSNEYQTVANKSTATNLGGGTPSDQLYPSQKAAKTYVDNAIYNAVGTGVADATTLAPGKVQLAGDLAGTATAPTVPGLANKENLSNKSTATSLGTSNDLYPTQNAVKVYVDQATQGIALQAAVDAKADKNSPFFTGTPNLPTGTIAVTQNGADNSTKIATTAFVQAATAAGIIDASSTTKGKLKLAGDLGGTAESPTVPGLALKANSADVTSSLALKEDASNKSTATALGTSDALYPSQKAVKTYVDSQIASATIADADASTKGKIQLAGDLGGTASSPTVPGLALKANMTDVNSSLALKAPINNPTFTGTVGGITNSMVGLGNVDNTSDANKPVSTATQTALDLKAPINNPTFTGTVGGITNSMVGLGNVDNTSDANKPVSTATQTALDLKAPLASPTFTGTPSLPTGTTAITQSAGDSTTKIATTAFVKNNFVPYSGANSAVNLGGYDLLVNEITVGKGNGSISSNLALGKNALKNTTGAYNTATGNSSLLSNDIGQKNSGFGNSTLRFNVVGNENTAAGYASLSNTTGSNNTAIGSFAGYTNTTGTENTFIGKSADAGTNNLSNATAIGFGASVAASNTIQLGNTDVTNVKTSGTITAGAITYPNTAGTSGQILTSNGSGTASWADAAGGGVPYTGATGAVNLGAYDLTVYGLTVGRGKGGISSNTATGANSLKSNTLGTDNTANGYLSLSSNSSGYFNTSIGSYSLIYNTIGNSNTAIGSYSLLFNTSGGGNNANGYQSLRKNTIGNYNTSNGTNSLGENTDGSYNTALGYLAGSILANGWEGNSTSDYSVYLGAYTKASATNAQNEVVIGYNAIGGGSNTVTLGNSSIATLRAQVTSITSLSDRRDKTEITSISEGIDFVKKLNPVTFTWNTRDKAKVGIKSAGFIAQELLALQKGSTIGDNLDLVSDDNPEKLEARYSNLLPVMVKAIQEQQKQLEEQKNKLDEQDKQIDLQNKKIDALNKKMDEVLELLKSKK